MFSVRITEQKEIITEAEDNECFVTFITLLKN